VAGQLESVGYGKQQVRLVKVERLSSRHELRDLTVSIDVGGEFEAAYLSGDNEGLLTTDAMRNVVYVVANERCIGPLEEFALTVARRLLAASARVTLAEVAIAEHGWAPMEVDGDAHPHAFREEVGSRTAIVTLDGEGERRFESGIEEFVLLKSAGSRFTGFLRERHTSLPESDDRILATSLSASWRYEPEPDDWDRSWRLVRDALLEEFARHESESAQHTLFLLGERALAVCPELQRLRLRLPNIHHLPFDVTRFGGSARNDVFVATGEPFGDIYATVRRGGP
jgi:urate oxidase